jgi:hypothetical protein
MYGQDEVYCFDCRPPMPTRPTPESARSTAQPCDVCRQDWRDAGWQCGKCDGYGQGCSGANIPHQQTGLVASAIRPRHVTRDVRCVDDPNFACGTTPMLVKLDPAATARVTEPRRGDGESHGGAVARPVCSPDQFARQALSGPPLSGQCSRPSSYPTSSCFKDSADEDVAGGVFGVAPRDSLRCERCGADDPPYRTVCNGPCQRWVGEECHDMYGHDEVYCFDCRPPIPSTPTPSGGGVSSYDVGQHYEGFGEWWRRVSKPSGTAGDP